MSKLQKNQDLIFRRNLECKLHTQGRAMAPNVLNSAFLLLHYLSHAKAIVLVAILGKRRYPQIHFEYKTASEGYLELIWFQAGLLKHSKYQADTFFCVKKSKTCLILSTTSA